MSQHVVVTMFQVFLVLVTIGLVVGTTSALKAAWQRFMERPLDRSPAEGTARDDLASEPETAAAPAIGNERLT